MARTPSEGSYRLQQVILRLVVLLLESLHIDASGGCRELDFLDCIQNKALINHTIHTSNVLSPGLEQCQHLCFLNHACVSYNLGATKGMIRTCELSNTDHVGYPDHVISKDGFEYCPIMSPCSPTSCPADLTCHPDFSINSFVCTCNNSKPLGMEDGRILDSAINASSQWDSSHASYLGRLNHVRPATVSSWSALKNEIGEYLQVSLGGEFFVNGVATQGRPKSRQWVTSYTLSYRLNATSWIEYNEDKAATAKIFDANSDQNTTVSHKLNPFKASFAKIIVQTWHEHISMKMELYGCKLE